MNDTEKQMTVERWSAQLHRYFMNHEDQHCLLLLNPARRNLLEQEELMPHCEKKERHALPVEAKDFHLEWRPILVQLQLDKFADSEVLRTSLEAAWDDWHPDMEKYGLGHRMGAILGSKLPAPEIASRLAQHVVHYDRSPIRHWLRWHDPRVLHFLSPLLSPIQRSIFFDAIDIWFYIAPTGELSDAMSVKSHYMDNEDHVVYGRKKFLLDALQWMHIQTFGGINQGCNSWRNNQQEMWISQLQILVAQDAVLRALTADILDIQDQALFVKHALTVHPYFDLHPLLESVLSDCKSGDYYRGAITKLSQEDWHVIARDQNSRGNSHAIF